MLGMNQLRQVKKSIAMKIGMVARRKKTPNVMTVLWTTASSARRFFSNFGIWRLSRRAEPSCPTNMRELDPAHRAWEKGKSTWEKSGF